MCACACGEGNGLSVAGFFRVYHPSLYQLCGIVTPPFSSHLLPPLSLCPPSGLHYDEGPASPARRVLPVFVFDVSDSGEFGLLIDGTVKATAFADMVVAVSSRAEKTSSHFTCRCGQ